MKENMGSRLFNLKQVNWMMEFGCIAKEAKMIYYEDTDKVLFYVRFLDDDVYKEAMRKWRNWDR